MPDKQSLEHSLSKLKSHKAALEDILNSRLKLIGAIDMVEVDQLRREVKVVSRALTKLSNLVE